MEQREKDRRVALSAKRYINDLKHFVLTKREKSYRPKDLKVEQ